MNPNLWLYLAFGIIFWGISFLTFESKDSWAVGIHWITTILGKAFLMFQGILWMLWFFKFIWGMI